MRHYSINSLKNRGVLSSLNFTDDLLDELRKRQAKEKESVGQPSRMKEFFKRNSRRFLVAGILVVIFSALAFTPGIGYTTNVKVVSTQLLVQNHPCYGYVCDGTMSTSFNRFFFPVNHLFGSEVSTTFSRISEPYDSSGKSVEEGLVIDTFLLEFPVNIPFFFVIGYIIAVGLDKSIQKVRSMRK